MKEELLTIKNSIAINANNVVNYIMTFNDSDKLDKYVIDNHIIMPPYDNIFVEHDRDIIDIVIRDEAKMVPARQYNSIHILFHKVDDLENNTVLKQKKIKYLMETRNYCLIKYDKVFNVAESDVFLTRIVVLVTEDGKIINECSITDEELIRPELPDYLRDGNDKPINIKGNLIDKLDLLDDYFKIRENVIGKLIRVGFMIYTMTLTFMNCKNVKLNEVDPSEKLSNTKRKKLARHNKLPYRYYELMVKPMRSNRRDNGGEVTGENSYAIHICRGHFKDYTKGKGLFGKYKGLFWWDYQTRGNDDNSVVDKGYKVRSDYY